MIDAHMLYCSKITDKPNLINHMSKYDGIKRSLKACHIIENFNPKDSDDLVKIIYENNSVNSSVIWNFSFFKDNDKLVKYCHDTSQNRYNGHYSKGESYKWYMERCVTHADDIDLTADIWKLSPDIKQKYPSKELYFMGTYIGEGWHDFHKDVMNKLEKIYK